MQSQLDAFRSQEETIDHFLPFRVDQRHLNIASQLGEPRTDLVEQSGSIPSDEFEQRAVGRTSIIKAHLGANFDSGSLGSFELDPALHQPLQARLAGQNLDDAALEACRLGGRKFPGAVRGYAED